MTDESITDGAVTAATLDNVPEIIALCYKDFDEVGKTLEKPDTITAIRSMCNFVNQGLVFVKKAENDTIVGVLALTPFNFWWAEKPILTIAVVYVLPEQRKNRVGDELITEAKAFADASETKIYIDIPEKDLDRKGIYLTRKGFEKVGEVYSYTPR